MKLAILGSTGATGLCLVRQALDAGHRVVTIVRNPDKLRALHHDSLNVVTGNIFSVESLAPPLEGCDAVLSCLGTEAFFSSTTFYSESCKVIVDAMRRAKLKRFVFMSSWYIKVDPNDNPGIVPRWIIRPILGRMLSDIGRMEDYLVDQCQDIDFTSVRPPRLYNGDITDKSFLVEERQFAEGAAFSIARADVARFMLQCLETDQYNMKLMSIGIK